MAAQAREELSRQTTLLTQEQDDNDPFADCEDEDELEINETLIDDMDDDTD